MEAVRGKSGGALAVRRGIKLATGDRGFHSSVGGDDGTGFITGLGDARVNTGTAGWRTVRETAVRTGKRKRA